MAQRAPFVPEEPLGSPPPHPRVSARPCELVRVCLSSMQGANSQLRTAWRQPLHSHFCAQRMCMADHVPLCLSTCLSLLLNVCLSLSIVCCLSSSIRPSVHYHQCDFAYPSTCVSSSMYLILCIGTKVHEYVGMQVCTYVIMTRMHLL